MDFVKKTILFRIRNIANRKLLIGNNQCYELNDSAAVIWKNLTGKNDFKKIEQILKEEFDLTGEEEVQGIIVNCIENFIEIGAAKIINKRD